MRKKIIPIRFVYLKKNSHKKIFVRAFSLLLLILGFVSLGLVVSPFLDLQFNYGKVLGEADITIPIPKSKVVKSSQFPNPLANSIVNLSGIDYTNAKNWFPDNPYLKNQNDILPTYLLSIPKLGIDRATVSTTNDDLAKNLVHYNGSGIPGKTGKAVVFGHSTLPQLFNPKDYKTIFATLHTLKIGDEIVVDYDNVTYTYSIIGREVVDPDNTSVLSQQYNDSYLTLITCTPPGTYWKRLVIKAKIKNIS